MNAALPAHKTKIVATIGPASESPEMLARLIRAGMNVARLNFSHGSPSKHAEVIRRIREAAREMGTTHAQPPTPLPRVEPLRD